MENERQQHKGASETENTTPIQPEEEKTASAVTKLLAIIGLVAILALSAWISIQAIRLAPSGFSTIGNALSSAGVYLSSIFGDENEENEHTLTLTVATTTITSDELFTLNWTGETGENASYSFEYSCAEDFSLSVTKGETTQELACEEAYSFDTASSSISFTPLSHENRYVDVTFTVRALTEQDGQEAELASDSMLLTVKNEDVADSRSSLTDPKTPRTDTTPTPTTGSGTYTTQPTTVYVPNPRAVENADGSADLAVTIVATGVVVEVKNKDVFTPLSPIPTDERGAVQFMVENRGDKSSGSWDFTANLPIEGDDDYKYDSPRQKALRPGDKITFTLSFDDVLEEDEGEIRIQLDTDSNDKSSSNDTVRKTVKIDEE